MALEILLASKQLKAEHRVASTIEHNIYIHTYIHTYIYIYIHLHVHMAGSPPILRHLEALVDDGVGPGGIVLRSVYKRFLAAR